MAYRRQQTTGSKIIRAKLPSTISRISRIIPGMYKCRKYGKECTICPWVKEGKIAISTNAGYIKEITSHLTCQSRNIVYMIECDKCRLQYIGETDRSLKERISEHKGYVTKKHLHRATGAYFNLPGHTVDNMSVMAIQKIHTRGTPYRKELEKEEISNFSTYHKRINKSPSG